MKATDYIVENILPTTDENENEITAIQIQEVGSTTYAQINHPMGTDEVLDALKKGDTFTASFVQDSNMDCDDFKAAMFVEDNEVFGYFTQIEAGV